MNSENSFQRLWILVPESGGFSKLTINAISSEHIVRLTI